MILTNQSVPSAFSRDADYRGPLMREAIASNNTRYVTLERDLGAFNNARLSLECAVAIAAATGRTLVLPPPFFFRSMNKGMMHRVIICVP